MHQLMKEAAVGGDLRADCPPTCSVHVHAPPIRCQHLVPVATLLILWIHILVCVVMLFVSSSLHHGVAHWNCIVFPGGERNCGVHELICVRKGRVGQSPGRLTSDAWPETFIHMPVVVRSHWSVSACLLFPHLARHRAWLCFLCVFTLFCVVCQWTNNVYLLQRVAKWGECACFIPSTYCPFWISTWFNWSNFLVDGSVKNQ